LKAQREENAHLKRHGLPAAFDAQGNPTGYIPPAEFGGDD